MRRIIPLFPLLIVGLLFSFPAQSQHKLEATFGKGLPFYGADSSFYLKFSTRIQNKYMAEGPVKKGLTSDDLSSNFMVRRARLKFSGFAYHPDLRYKMEFGLSNSDLDKVSSHTANASNVILDAVLKWDVHDNLSLWAGQTKLPGNRERVISSQELQFVDRSLVNANYTLDRDVGIQVHHHFHLGPLLIRDIYAISQGEGRNIVTGNHGGYNYTGRLEVLPFGAFSNDGDYVAAAVYREESPKLSIAASYDLNQNAIREEGQTGSFLPFQRDLGYTVVDLIFKYGGFSLMSEYAQRMANYPVMWDQNGEAIASFNTGEGFMVQSGYIFKNDLEVAGRFTTITPETITGRAKVNEYTLGVSRYVVGHDLKVQADLSYIEESTAPDPHLRFRLQTELSF